MDKGSGTDSPSPAPSARAPVQLRFTGNGAEYFRPMTTRRRRWFAMGCRLLYSLMR